MENMKSFFIGEYHIDISRSVIIKSNEETQIEPKVLQVLWLLAEHQGEVVTHKQLMETVWRGTEVVPNALQRCIAILRKELGDSAKSPKVIATHPRIGYRLIAEVRWITDAKNLNSQPDKIELITTPRSPINFTINKYHYLMVLILIVGYGLWSRLWSNTFINTPSYQQVEWLTQTDANESDAIYSPDAQYVVFNRYAGSCKSHIWAKQLNTGIEYQLTKNKGVYEHIRFTDDGREIVFANKASCDAVQNTLKSDLKSNSCWSITTLDFAAAINSPQAGQHRYQCQADKLLKIVALPNHQYVFMQSLNGNNELMSYDDLNKQIEPFYVSSSQYIYHFDYDKSTQRYVVLSRDKELNHFITLLNNKGDVVGKNKIRMDNTLSKNRLFSGNFACEGQCLLVASEQALFKLSITGELTRIQTPLNKLNSAVQHPTLNHLLVVQGGKDVDVGRVSVEQPIKDLVEVTDINTVNLPYASIARTKAQERAAKYQPNGNHIAFISDQSGQDQIWLLSPSNEPKLRKLQHKSTNHRIHNYTWSPDGALLAWVANDQLYVSDLQNKGQRHNTKQPLYAVVSWYKPNDMLVLINDHQPSGLYHLNIETNQLTALGINFVESAWVQSDILFYSDVNGQVFSVSLDGNKVSKQVTPMLHLNGRAMVVKDGYIYNVDATDFTLRQYDISGDLIKPIVTLKPTAWKLSDVKDNQVLVDQFISINNDVAIFK